MDQGKEEFVCLPLKKKDDLMEQAWKRIKEESRFRKMKMAAAIAGNIKPTEEGKEDTDEFEELLQGTVPLSPKESSTNNPKGMKMNVVEQAAEINNQQEEEKVVLSPKESSMNNPKGMEQKRVREEEEEEDKDKVKEKRLKADSLSDDTCTSNKFPSTSPIDKFVDSDKDGLMMSPSGDL